ncbi:hypothetical protein UFOVP150_22 [uncultured Caudovirales phage]|uniref:Uncharacterized protein n=1 Tax=uncultured Caudovirales phage TaxID=2100421 RepID=A0A6J7W6M3_9CAUD|nr:hypothetical protein UFOVP150_22 [uncultured Caudovirales phage]
MLANKNQPARTAPLLLLGTLILTLRLLPIPLPHDGYMAWVVNDIYRAAFECALSFAFLRYVLYVDLKIKVVVAALFGYSLADLMVCFIWYTLHLHHYLLASSVQFIVVLATSVIYWMRSYDQESDVIDDDAIYCLRRKPKSAQDLLISMCAFRGSYGAYVIVQNKLAYMFKGGDLVRFPADRLTMHNYHVTKGKIRKDMNLDSYVGTKWELLGSNCITLLGRYWGRYGR